jgi:hypothetical protein
MKLRKWHANWLFVTGAAGAGRVGEYHTGGARFPRCRLCRPTPGRRSFAVAPQEPRTADGKPLLVADVWIYRILDTLERGEPRPVFADVLIRMPHALSWILLFPGYLHVVQSCVHTPRRP